MKPNQLKQTISGVFIIAFGFAAVFYISGFIEKNRLALPAGFEDEDLAVQGANLKGYSLGFEGLLADWYWMNSLQYVGAKLVNSKEDVSLDNLKPLNPRLLYPYLENATTLDPQFMSVYEYGAVVLPAIDNEQAIKLTEKGIENNPNQWRLYQHLGYIYWRLKDYEKAATVYEKGSQIAGAPIFMKQMAAKMKTEGGSRETAREIYREMFDKSEDAQARDLAARRLLELDSLDEREVVKKALDEFKLKNNRCVNSWSEIFPLLKNARLPNGKDFAIDKSNNLIDPTGAPYLLNKENCSIELDENKTGIPLN
jgi:tetratricopeptide (TPR) repeat protein